MMNYQQKIQRVYPNLAIHKLEVNQSGQNNRIIIVNDDLVFRFPLYEAGREQLTVEQHILHQLHDRLPLPTPKPHYINLSAPIGDAFMGYPKISGDTINIYTLEQNFDDATCNKLARQLATFLKALHTIPIDSFQEVLPCTTDYTDWKQVYQQIREHLYHKMRPDAREAITVHFEKFFESDHQQFTPTLIHGDFGTGNILFDKTTHAFSGVIDFGSVAIGDPAIDAAALYGFNGRGKAFFARIATLYPALDTMLPRIQFYSGTFALLEALHGVINDDDDALKAGLELYI